MLRRRWKIRIYQVVSILVAVSLVLQSTPVLASSAPRVEGDPSIITTGETTSTTFFPPEDLESKSLPDHKSSAASPHQNTPSITSFLTDERVATEALLQDPSRLSPQTARITARRFWTVIADDSPPTPPGWDLSLLYQENPTNLQDRQYAPLAASIPLQLGWNLVSIPEEPADTDPAAVLASIVGSYDQVYAFDGCDPADPWKLYDPANPGSNDLLAIDHTIGFWVDMTTEDVLEVSGTAYPSTDIPLCEGWNLIGYPLAQALPVAGVLNNIEGKYSRVFGYDLADGDDPWEVYDVAAPDWANDLQMMQPGRGYWILATEDTALTISMPGPGPVVEITAPSEGDEITSPTDVLATITSTTTSDWILEYTFKDEATWIPFASGDTSVSGDVQGSFDPTLLLNGIYEIRLTATDLFGQSSSVSVNVVVAGDMKVGHFTLSYFDLNIPVAGIPIQIIRTYDSRDKRTGDFGVGWTLDIKDVRLQENDVIGIRWRQTVSGGIFPTYCIEPTASHVVSITLPSGSVHKFEPTVNPQCQLIAPIQFATVGFRPLPGTNGSLIPLGANDVLITGSSGPVELLYFDTLLPYDPDGYRLTMQDGRVMDINQMDGLQRVVDTNGNTLTITSGGIIHSSGKSVLFTRDPLGRITSIEDPNGNAMSYQYDANGDLVSYTDREGNTTTFTYLSAIPHHLDRIEDPTGVQPIRNEYDESGRLVRHIDAFGKTIEYTHNIDTRQEIVVDRNGGLRVMDYDDRGNVVKETDPDGKVILRAFDARDNVISETAPHDPGDPNPSTTSFSYDVNDNLLSRTDPLGNTTSHTYNPRGQVLTTTDPFGNVTSHTYDANGNLLTITDAAGNVTSFTFDSQGNALTETDAAGNMTQFAYDASGNLIRETDGLGNETTYTYNANGKRLAETTGRTTPTGPEILTKSFTYDKQGRLISTTYPDGSMTKTNYNSRGEREATIDQLGHVTNYVYDALGQLTQIVYPDGTSQTFTYDPGGRQLTNVDRAGRVTSFVYDELGRPTGVIFPDGAAIINTFDDAGRLVASTDALGNTTNYEYDAAGRRTKIIDPLGNAISYGHDANGNRTSMTDPNGGVTSFEYDALERLRRTTFPDGTSVAITYDSLGNRISETDQAGHTTQFEYDALGRLTKVIDALGQSTTYAYDEVGNRISHTDANGHTTSYEHDQLGREIKRTLPDGQSEIRSYNAVGNLASRTDFAGRVTTFSYDVNNRLITRTYPDSSSVSITYTPTGQRATVTDARGTTSFTYTLRDLLQSQTYPDGRKLEYQYDTNGNRTRMTVTLGVTVLMTTYTYDAASRLMAVTDPDGRTYSYGYDSNGNRVFLTYPNGVSTTYTYDTLNRLTDLTSVGPSGTIQSYQFTLGSAGNREQIEEQDGSVREYTYDALYRLTGERVRDLSGVVYEKTFSYDPVGNRLSQTTTGLGAGMTNYSYDSRDRLLTENAITYSWDANGNLTSKSGEATYVWDFEERLVRVEKDDGTVIKYTYDADDNRVATEIEPPSGPSTTTHYLVDIAGSLDHVVAEIDASGNLIAFYVRGDDLLSVIRPSGTRYYLADGLGSIRFLTDEVGNVTDSYTYTAFGELYASTGTDPNPYRFAGEPYDINVGFSYNRARWMDPNVGRFISQDPFAGLIFDPPTLHRYLYAAANPVNYIDPTGQFFSIGGIVLSFSFQVLLRVAVGVGIAWIQYAGSALFRFGITLRSKAVGEMATGKLGPEGWKAAMQEYRSGNAFLEAAPLFFKGFLTLATLLELGTLGIADMAEALKGAPNFGRISPVSEDFIPPFISQCMDEAIDESTLIEAKALEIIRDDEGNVAGVRAVEIAQELPKLQICMVALISNLIGTTK
ncbi:MAG: hypothetical protein GTO14_16420 [Anaerolineales bacterium]|nr:hypothetical protein [Anaerolineales bacterium]